LYALLSGKACKHLKPWRRQIAVKKNSLILEKFFFEIETNFWPLCLG
jgi:hypothetical protein